MYYIFLCLPIMQMREELAEMLAFFDMSGRMRTLVYLFVIGRSKYFFTSMEKVVREMRYIKRMNKKTFKAYVNHL